MIKENSHADDSGEQHFKQVKAADVFKEAKVDNFTSDPYYDSRKFTYPVHIVSEDYHIVD